MKNYYVVAAHLDDIEFGISIYLTQIIKPDDEIHFYIASSGLYKHHDLINTNRKEAQITNLKKLFPNNNISIEINPNIIDTLFFENKKTIRNLLENWISNVVNINNNENILITLAPDIHEDHRIISEFCDVIARPNLSNTQYNTFESYYKFYIPGNYEYQNKYNLGVYQQPYMNKEIINLSREDILFKVELLHTYPGLIIKHDNLVVNQEIIIKIF